MDFYVRISPRTQAEQQSATSNQKNTYSRRMQIRENKFMREFFAFNGLRLHLMNPWVIIKIKLMDKIDVKVISLPIYIGIELCCMHIM